MEVTVLSLRQPWAELVVSGAKTVELRTWNTRFRGLFYVHASRTVEEEYCRKYGFNPGELITGAIIGRVELKKVKRYENKKELRKDSENHCAPDYKTPCYGYILENAERIKPVKHKGSLGFRKKEITSLRTETF